MIRSTFSTQMAEVRPSRSPRPRAGADAGIVTSDYEISRAQDMCTKAKIRTYDKNGELTGMRSVIDMSCFKRLAPAPGK